MNKMGDQLNFKTNVSLKFNQKKFRNKTYAANLKKQDFLNLKVSNFAKAELN